MADRFPTAPPEARRSGRIARGIRAPPRPGPLPLRALRAAAAPRSAVRPDRLQPRTRPRARSRAHADARADAAAMVARRGGGGRRRQAAAPPRGRRAAGTSDPETGNWTPADLLALADAREAEAEEEEDAIPTVVGLPGLSARHGGPARGGRGPAARRAAGRAAGTGPARHRLRRRRRAARRAGPGAAGSLPAARRRARRARADARPRWCGTRRRRRCKAVAADLLAADDVRPPPPERCPRPGSRRPCRRCWPGATRGAFSRRGIAAEPVPDHRRQARRHPRRPARPVLSGAGADGAGCRRYDRGRRRRDARPATGAVPPRFRHGWTRHRKESGRPDRRRRRRSR